MRFGSRSRWTPGSEGHRQPQLLSLVGADVEACALRSGSRFDIGAHARINAGVHGGAARGQVIVAAVWGLEQAADGAHEGVLVETEGLPLAEVDPVLARRLEHHPFSVDVVVDVQPRRGLVVVGVKGRLI